MSWQIRLICFIALFLVLRPLISAIFDAIFKISDEDDE